MHRNCASRRAGGPHRRPRYPRSRTGTGPGRRAQIARAETPQDGARDLVLDWEARSPASLDREVLSGRHALHEAPLLSDAVLERLIERHPRDCIQAHAMAGDSAQPSYVDISVGTRSAADVLEAVSRGRIWMSFTCLESAHPEVRRGIEVLYTELRLRCPGFAPRRLIAHLLVSSPGAEVFYHADAYAGLLWQLRGRKRVLVYPAWDDRFLPRDVREACLAGQLVDGPYDPAFDAHARTFPLEAGDFIGWPQSTPHRVENDSVLNISLATEHQTAVSARRRTDAAANFWFRNTLGLHFSGVGREGLRHATKRAAFRALRRSAKLLGRPLALPGDPPIEPPRYQLDPADPRGFSERGPQRRAESPEV